MLGGGGVGAQPKTLEPQAQRLPMNSPQHFEPEDGVAQEQLEQAGISQRLARANECGGHQ